MLLSKPGMLLQVECKQRSLGCTERLLIDRVKF